MTLNIRKFEKYYIITSDFDFNNLVYVKHLSLDIIKINDCESISLCLNPDYHKGRDFPFLTENKTKI